MFAIAVWLWFFLSVYCCLWFVGYISIHDVYLFTIEVLHTKLEGVILHYVYVSKESLLNFTGVVYSLLLKVSCFAWLEKKKVYKNLFPQILYGFSNTLSVSAILFYSVYAITRASASLRFAFYTVWKVSLFGVFLVRIFLDSDWIRRDTEYVSVFSPNAGKWGPEKIRIQTFLRCVNATPVSCPVIIKGMIKGIL